MKSAILRPAIITLIIGLLGLGGLHAEAQAGQSCDAGGGRAGVLTSDQKRCLPLDSATGSCDAGGGTAGLRFAGNICLPDPNAVAAQQQSKLPVAPRTAPTTANQNTASQNTNSNVSPNAGRLDLSYVQGYASQIQYAINFIFVPILFAVAFAYFLFGVYKYFILGATSDKERQLGRDFILWGTVGFAAIISVWGLVYVVLQTFGLSPATPRPNYPLL
jgi:hypothetical protein